MPSSLYVALSGQVAAERRLNAVANNVANMDTAGFRAEQVKFDTILSRSGPMPVAYASSGDTFISRRAGPAVQSGNPLDVAAFGGVWLGIDTPDGTVYTRDGRMHMNEAGDLLSVEGYPVVDPGGAPITLVPDGGEVQIGVDGTINQGGRLVGGLGLFVLPADSRLSRYGNSGVQSSLPGEVAEDPLAGGVRQGFVEGSNVNPLMEMTKLIMITRAFEAAASAVETQESTLDEAIRTLGPT